MEPPLANRVQCFFVEAVTQSTRYGERPADYPPNLLRATPIPAPKCRPAALLPSRMARPFESVVVWRLRRRHDTSSVRGAGIPLYDFRARIEESAGRNLKPECLVRYLHVPLVRTECDRPGEAGVGAGGPTLPAVAQYQLARRFDAQGAYDCCPRRSAGAPRMPRILYSARTMSQSREDPSN